MCSNPDNNSDKQSPLWKLPADKLLELVSQNDPDAIVEYALRNYNDYGGFRQNYQKVLELLEPFEKQENPLVLVMLGYMYRNGYGIPDKHQTYDHVR